MKKLNCAKFIKEAVRRRAFDRTVQDIKRRNANTDPVELQQLIDKAVDEVRAAHRVQGIAQS